MAESPPSPAPPPPDSGDPSSASAAAVGSDTPRSDSARSDSARGFNELIGGDGVLVLGDDEEFGVEDFLKDEAGELTVLPSAATAVGEAVELDQIFQREGMVMDEEFVVDDFLQQEAAAGDRLVADGDIQEVRGEAANSEEVEDFVVVQAMDGCGDQMLDTVDELGVDDYMEQEEAVERPVEAEVGLIHCVLVADNADCLRASGSESVATEAAVEEASVEEVDEVVLMDMGVEETSVQAVDEVVRLDAVGGEDREVIEQLVEDRMPSAEVVAEWEDESADVGITANTATFVEEDLAQLDSVVTSADVCGQVLPDQLDQEKPLSAAVEGLGAQTEEVGEAINTLGSVRQQEVVNVLETHPRIDKTEASVSESDRVDGSDMDALVAAPDTDCTGPSGLTYVTPLDTIEIKKAQIPEPIAFREVGSSEALVVDSLQLIESAVGDELPHSDLEVLTTSTHEERVGEANVIDKENTQAFEQLGDELLPVDIQEKTATQNDEDTGEENEINYDKALAEVEMLPTDAEENPGPQHEEAVDKTNEMDDAKSPTLDPVTTTPVEEISELGDVGAKVCEVETDGIDVALLPGSRVAAANNDAAIDAYLMHVDESDGPVAESTPRGRGQRKRGRPLKAHAMKTQVTKTPPKKRKEKEDQGEEVCFICFDGGELVVCDRRGCPKVYHPACVNRDEAFFRAKGRWNCGWHICSNCQKSAQYLCYTCTFSLCKLCINEASFVRVRENKGFCATCMSTVILIESIEDGSKKPDSIDFDDKNSWMYLFKDYWLDVKQKLSFTVEELTRAKTRWKNSNGISKDLDATNDADGGSSDSSSARVKVAISSKRKAKKRARSNANEVTLVKEAESEEASIPTDACWASEELLELVAHMKDGDISAISEDEVQQLLLEYIKVNNLRAPRARSQVICDPMLQRLFGQSRVGHFEMLKLLESHFLAKMPSPVLTDDNQGGVLDPDPGQVDTEGNSDASTRPGSDKRRRTYNKLREKEPQNNLHDYAAIDVHNICLIYLRRNLMEDLLDDVETFCDNVVGAFARIRITGTGLYRLVQIVGTDKAAKKYTTGKKKTDISLKILNLDKTEFINIDIISNQEFSEEECKRLRQSIKCGFIARLTVGEIQEKARVLQAVRVKDCLENEKLRFSNLRDRASEQGRRKELRECVEKLQLLSTPEERIRRLNEVPDIHVDPKMDPDYESSEDEEDEKKLDNSDRKYSFLRRGSDVISSGKGVSLSGNTWSSDRKNARTGWEPKKNIPEESPRDIGSSGNACNRPNDLLYHQEERVQQTSSPRFTGSPLARNSGQSSTSPCATISTSTLTTPVETSSTNESEKIWHYKDPSEKIQGPFSLTQLRKWNSTGYFPAKMVIWRASERPEDSILLTDALIGKFQKDLPQSQIQSNSIAQTLKEPNLIDDNGSSYSWRENNDNTRTYDKQNSVNWKAAHNDTGAFGTGNRESMRTDMWTAHSSVGSTARPEPVNPKDERVALSFRGWQSNDNNSPQSGQPQGNFSSTEPHYSGSSYRTPSYNSRGGRGRWNGGQDRQSNWSSNKTRGVHPSNQGYDHRPSWNNSRQESSGGHLNSLPANNTSNQLRHNSFNRKLDDHKSHLNTNENSSVDRIVPTPPTNTTASNLNVDGTRSNAHQLQNYSVKDIKDMATSDSLESVSPQGSVVTSEQKQEPSGSSANKAGDASTLRVPGNNQNSSLMFPVGSQVSTPFHGNATAGLTAPPLNFGQGGALQNNATALVPQANSGMIWGSAIQANANAPWGPVTEGNMSVVWGIRAQGNANLSTIWGTPVQANPSVNTGWGVPAQGDVGANMVWGSQTQGSANQTVLWAATAGGNTTSNAGWGAPVHVNPVPAPSFGGPMQGNMNQNVSWGMSTQGNASVNVSMAGQGNTNSSWNDNSRGTQPNQMGDRQSGRHSSGHGGGRPSWNRMQPVSGSGPSQPPMNGEDGVCRFFHDFGHCKKGAYCSYIHES